MKEETRIGVFKIFMLVNIFKENILKYLIQELRFS